MNHFAVGIGDAISHVWGCVVVIEVQELTGIPIDFGVRRHLRLGTTIQMKCLAGLQGHGIECNRIPRVVPKAHQITVEREYIGVRRVLDSKLGNAVVKRPHHTRRHGLPCCSFVAKCWGINPSIDVARTVIANMKRMHHAIAVKRVIAIFWLEYRVRAIAVVGTAQIAGQLADDL